MNSDLFGAAAAALVGLGLGALTYILSKYVLQKHPARFSAITVLRQAIQVLYLVLLFLLGDRTPWNKNYLLIGGVVGITLATGWFTYRLVKINEKSKAESTGKEDLQDG